MMDFNETTATDAVLARMDQCDNPRLKAIMASVVHHLHAVIRETEPTMEEWMQAIQFLTATGQICDDKRQEWILLSDTLGVSMLVDAINNRKPSGATESTVLGPFHVDGAPELPLGATISQNGQGDVCVVRGRVVALDGTPIAGAHLDVWQTSHDGFYDVQQPGVQPEMNLRGIFRTDEDGRFWFRTVQPSAYPIPTDGPVGRMLTALGRHPYRPAHIHFIISADGFAPVTTHIFADGDRYLESDAVFGVKKSLIEPFRRVDDPAAAAGYAVDNPFLLVEHEFGLARVTAAA